MDALQVVSTKDVRELRDSFNAFCGAQHIDSSDLAPNEFTSLLRETAANIWLSDVKPERMVI